MAEPQTLKGYENIGGKRIPFVRSGSWEYIVTTYGSQDATDNATKGTTLLVKHERRGAASWGGVAAGSVLIKGPVTNKLQGILDTVIGNNLFHAVEFVRHFPEKLSEIGHEYTAGRMIHDAILEDIVSGKPENTLLIAKCIEAAPLREKASKRERIYNALIDAANQLKRIPIKREVLERWEAGEIGGEAGRDLRNFEKELKGMGLDWLPFSL